MGLIHINKNYFLLLAHILYAITTIQKGRWNFYLHSIGDKNEFGLKRLRIRCRPHS